jgi:hypothetical protein
MVQRSGKEEGRNKILYNMDKGVKEREKKKLQGHASVCTLGAVRNSY